MSSIDFLPSLKRLFTNKIYILYLLSNIVMFNAFVVIITYTPKFFEQQFGMSASKTNFLIGMPLWYLIIPSSFCPYGDGLCKITLVMSDT